MIRVARYGGFCFGVSRAVTAVEKLTEGCEKGRIFTLGNIIHNPTVVSDLKEKGVVSVSSQDIQSIFEKTDKDNPSTVVIRTHGVEKHISDTLERLAEQNPYFHVMDCTCPYVQKIHKIVSENSKEDAVTLIFGDGDHPEVLGIQSYAKGRTFVFSTAEQLEREIIPKLGKNSDIIMVSQTTQKLSEWKKCQKILNLVFNKAIIFDTICSVTENRQTEAKELAERSDVMIVVGGRESSNTNKLYRTASAVCPRTYLIETADEVRGISLEPGLNIAITAGASTPDSIIEEVKTIMSEEIKDGIVTEEEIAVQEGQAAPEAEITTVQEGDDFAKMLDETFKTLNTGDVVTGVITSIAPTEIHVDIGAKSTGILMYDDITDEPGVKLEEVFKIGDEITAYAVRVSDVDGIATLSKKKYDAKSNWNTIVELYNSGEYVEGKFVEIVKGGAICIIKGVKAFVPASHTTVERDGDMSALLGQKMPFKVIEVDEGRRRVKASARIPARAAAREARKAAEVDFWNEIEVGKVYTGTVRAIQSYGAFVELGAGVDGMVHTTELSWNHIKSPAEVVSVGDEITVFVKSFDVEKKRISLGYKTEETNPWNLFTSQYNVGDVVSVKIVNIMPFGAFGEVLPGADGLIHVTELADKKVAKPEDVVSVGDVVDVKIIDINYEKKKISLSIRALIEESAADEADEAPEAEEEISDAE